MAAIGGIPKTYDQIRDESMEKARVAGLVAKYLEGEATCYGRHSAENQAFLSAAQIHRRWEHEHLEYAGWMQVAILCGEAGYETGGGSVFNIEMAQKRWREETAQAA